jgi:Tfp pilus assembly protein PilN
LTPALLIGCAAAVVIVLAIFVIWFVNYRGQKEGAADANAQLANKNADAGRKAADIVAEYRDDDDAVIRLRRGDF